MSKNVKDSLPSKRNPQPFAVDTTQRQRGGNTAPETGEVHGQRKAERITEGRRFAGAENTPLANSPGRVNEDVSGDD